jgi:hypothetical protein
MPEMTPVGNTIIPQNPMTGINTMSGILGLKQQQQALQTGQYQQETAQAGAEQAQQKNREFMAVGGLVKNSASSGRYLNEDGSFNKIKFANDVSAVAPTYGQEIANQAVSGANEIVLNKQAHQNLTMDRKKEIGATFASLAADPNVNNSDFIDAIEKLRQTHKNDPEFSRMLTSMTTHYPGTASPDQQRQVLGKWSAAATGEPQAAPGQVDTGTAIQPGAVNRFTGGFTPAGAIRKDLSGAAAAPASGANDEQRYAQISQEATKSQTVAALADQVSKLAGEVRTGKLTKDWADKLTVLRQSDPSITARQMLGKYAAQLQTAALENASTDSERGQISTGMPNPDAMDPDAIKEAAGFLKGNARMKQARGLVADKYKSEHGGQSVGIRAVDDQFMQHADPFVFAYKDLSPGAERQEFLQKHFGKDETKIRAFLSQKAIAEHYGAK